MKKLKVLGIWGLLVIASLFLAGMLGVASACPEAAIGFTWLPVIGLGFMKMIDWKSGIKAFNDEKKDDRAWEKASHAEKKAEILKAFNEAVSIIQSRPVGKTKMVGPDSALMGAVPIVQVMADPLKTPDRGYEMIFEEVDMRSVANDTFNLLDVSGGVTFYQLVASSRRSSKPLLQNSS